MPVVIKSRQVKFRNTGSEEYHGISAINEETTAEAIQKIEQAKDEALNEIPDSNELMNIRVGADGTVYPSAGDAVRDQIGDLKEDLFNSEVYKDVSFNFEIGALDGNGKILGDNNVYFYKRARLHDVTPIGSYTKISAITGYSLKVFYFDSASADSASSSTSWVTSASINKGSFVRILLKKNDDATISNLDTFLANFSFIHACISDAIDSIQEKVNDNSQKFSKVLDDLYSPSYSDEDAVPVTIQSNYYWNVETDKAVLTSHSSFEASSPIVVAENDIYKLTCRSGGSLKLSPWVIVDSEYNILEMGSRSSSQFIATDEIIIPENGAYLLITAIVNKEVILIKGEYTLSENKLFGKKVAIIGDSISTNGNAGTDANVPEITIETADVGVQLSAYLTYYDVQAGLSLGGHTFTSSEIGTEVTFTPTAEDVGKSIGLPNNYNENTVTTWWEVMQDELGCKCIPNTWSGASVTSHEGNVEQYKTSYGWHDATIRKCGIRTAGSMNRTAPDVVIIYRGTNDFSHSPYTLLTDGYFDSYDWQYPSDDNITGGYGYKEGLCLTIKKLRDTYQNAKIFLCTLNIFKRINYSHFPTNNGINSLPQYNDAIREVADFMGCGIIEFDKDGITFENCYSQGYITDSATIPTHPSDKGHKAMGLKAIVDLKAQYSNMA